MQKRILFISDHGDPLATLGGEQAGGQNNYVKQLSMALSERGHSVDVVTHWANADAPKIEHFGENCRVIRVAAGIKGFVEKSNLYSMLPDFYYEMRETLSLSTYDVMHTHYWLSGLLGRKTSLDIGLPWLHTSHSLSVAKQQATGVSEPKRRSAEELILETADSIVATTKTERKLIRSVTPDPAPIHVIPIGVDETFQPEDTNSSKNTPFFVFAGRLEETKGIYTLIKAFRLLLEQKEIPPSAKLCIAGGDTYQIDLKRKSPKSRKLQRAISGIEDYVEFIGPRTQEELSELFNKATAVIVPSTYESFGMVAAEAQACGSPVIASEVGGLKDVVKDLETGIHVQKENPAHLASAMKFLAMNKDVAQSLGRKAASRARKEFNWSRIAKRMDQLYEVVAGETQAIHVSN